LLGEKREKERGVRLGHGGKKRKKVPNRTDIPENVGKKKKVPSGRF